MTQRPELLFRGAARLVIVAVRAQGWRVDVRGVERIPREGGAIVAFNHHSYVDFFMAAWGVYRGVGRPIRFLAKRELFAKPLIGGLLRNVKQVPVDRGSRVGRAAAFDDAVRALKAGEIIAVAPEQTISRSFELLPFRTGAVRMAQQAGVPIVPSVSWGSHRFATKGRRPRPRFRLPVLIRYGEPIRVGPDEDPARATARLHEAMRAMLDEVQRSYPDQPRHGDDWWVPRRLGGSAPSHDEVLDEHAAREETWREDA